MEPRRIYRVEETKTIAGVCGGLGEYLNIDPTFIKLIWVILTFMTGILPLTVAYLICAVIIPTKSDIK